MKTDEMPKVPATGTREAGSVRVAREDNCHRFRLLTTTVQGTTGAPPHAWRSYRNVEEARLGAREMMRDQRITRVAIVEDHPPLQLIQWVH